MNKLFVMVALCCAAACASDKPKAEASESAAAPGAAYFGVQGGGVVALRDGAFERVIDASDTVIDIDIGPDGTVWVVAMGGVHRIQGDDAGQVGDSRSPGSMSRIAGGPGGTAWAVGSGGLAHYDGAAWRVEHRDVLGVTLLEDVAVDSDGQPWVLSPHAVHRRDGGAWTASDIGAGEPGRTFLRAIEAGRDGAMYVAGNIGVRAYRDGAWSEHPLRAGYRGVDQLAVAPNGDLRGLTGLDGVSIHSGGSTKAIDAESSGFIAAAVDDLAVDAAGRTWLGTDYGVAILDERGALLQQWAPGTVPELRGTVRAIAVEGAGPALPRIGDQALGTLRGRIASDGAGVSGAVVELCESPSMLFKVSPCDSAVFRRRVRTEDDGTFQVELPIGSYGFAIRRTKASRWLITLGSDCCGAMKAGQVYDMGSLSIDR